MPQSYTLSGTGTAPSATYTISPVFTLSPVTISSPPTSDSKGKFAGISGEVISLNAAGNGFVVLTADGFPLTINTDSSTVYQGVAGFTTLAVGTLVDTDLVIQPDGSLRAARVEVDDLTAPTTSIGPELLGPDPQPNEFSTLAIETEGCTVTAVPFCNIIFQYNPSTMFNISGEFTNLQSLPFAPTFSAATMFPGQNFSVFSAGTFQAPQPVTTVTLLPQTLNGTVTAVSAANSFTVYTVALAPYDLIPTTQGFVNLVRHLNNPNIVMVYVDSDTQLLNSTPVATGSVLRFRGLLFDDNSTVRMDCNLIRDGVPE